MKIPMFSFVVPVYGTEKWLSRCLDSILAQQLKDFEIVVVDDCSPNDCKAIVDKYTGKCKYIRHSENKGLLQARLTGLRAAAGKYVIPLDSDDYVLPGLTQALENTILRYDYPDIIAYGMENESADGSITPYSSPNTGLILCREAICRMFQLEFIWNMAGKVFKAEPYRAAVSAFDEKEWRLNTAEDLLQTISVCTTAKFFASCSYLGYRYVHNPSSLTNGLQSRNRFRNHVSDTGKSLAWCERQLRERGNAEALKLFSQVKRQIVRWNLAPLANFGYGEKSIRINIMCDALNEPWMVLSECIFQDQEFLSWYVPTKDVFQAPKGKISTIGVVCCRGFGGGAERATLLWVREMVKRGYRIVWFADPWFREEMPKKVQLPDGVEVVYLEYNSISKRIVDFKESLDRYCIDTVLLVDHWRDRVFADLIVAKCCGCRTIVTEHNVFFFPIDDLNAKLFIQRERYYHIPDAITVLSPENVAWWNAAGYDNIVYMPNFLTFEASDDIGYAPKKRLATLEFICVGRICRRKNALAIVEAFRIFLEEHPELASQSRLTFLGRYESPADQERIESAIACGHLENNVTVAGEVQDVSRYYKRATLLLMASRLEGAPMVIMEAKSYGVPTVMFDLPYIDGANEDEGVVLVEHGDTSALAGAMYSNTANPKKYVKLSQAARSSLSRFSREAISKRWARVFEMLEGNERIDPMCASVDATCMLQKTMKCISILAPVLDASWSNKQISNDDFSRELSQMRLQYSALLSLKDEVVNSRSYKIGRMISWPYRMVRNTGRCFKENGFRYTLGRIPKKFVNLWLRFFG